MASEQLHYGVSTKMFAVALEMLPAVLFAHGTHEQRLMHLPQVLRGDESWCLLLSEPDASSDLAGVTSVARPVDGGWSVAGQKVWTSGATSAEFALLIARTGAGGSGRLGLSCFALDMRQPGVEVRPLRQMSGGYHFNEVCLEDAFVPAEGLIGDTEGAGTYFGRCWRASGPPSAVAPAAGRSPSSLPWPASWGVPTSRPRVSCSPPR